VLDIDRAAELDVREFVADVWNTVPVGVGTARDDAVAVEVDAVGELEREEQELRVQMRAVRIVERRIRPRRVAAEVRVHRERKLRTRPAGRLVADEIEALLIVDAEAQVQIEADRDLRLQLRLDAERRDA